MTFNDNGYYYGAQIVVGNGGAAPGHRHRLQRHLATTPTAATTPKSIVNSGGHLQASGSTFALGQVYLADGVVFNAGDLIGDGFDSPLYIPAIDVQYLSEPATTTCASRPSTIQADTIASGQTLALNAIGTQTTANLRYVFPGGLTVNQGGLSPPPPASRSCFSGGLTMNQGGSVTLGRSDPVTIGPATSNANT